MINDYKIRYGRALWLIAVLLLMVNGIGILTTGYIFMSGQNIGEIPGMITAFKHVPSEQIFMHGIILFFVIGLACIIVSMIALFKKTFYPFLISLSGIALIAWIVAQVAFLGFLHPLLVAIGIASIILIPAGYFLKDTKR